ncbi:HlyC/CorC family transporter [Rhodospirillaceae bacterium SYSU D60014]|uniref:HlyC/CorC family transporter n=1 Tax=Virgifigura deserti TaxID=2268457 RepID=UPI000E672556
MAVTICAIVLLLALSAFFSGSETALTAASRSRMHTLELQGNRAAARVNRLRAHMERVIGAILLGNNLVNILGSALATSVLIALFGETGIIYATIGMTALVLLFGEVMPKTYAINNADKMALAIARVMQPIVLIFSPVTRVVQFIVRWIFRLFGVKVVANIGTDSTEEELRGAIDLHAGSAVEVHHAGAMLHSILDLDDVEVSDIMVHRRNIVLVEADLPPAQIIDEVLNSPYTRIPLWRGEPDNIIGVLHVKALLRAMQANGGSVAGLDVVQLAAAPWFIPDTTSLLAQLQAFRTRREHFALVVDEYGALMGIVTLEDILEEIVGDIADEHDVSVAGVKVESDGSYTVSGVVTIRDLNREFNWRLPDEEASTIAGLVLHEARQIPEKGQVFVFHGFRFEVLERQRNQIKTLRVTPGSSGSGETEPVSPEGAA